MDQWVRLRVTTHALRCIDKAGGLDNYLLNDKRKDQDSVVGQKLTELVLERLAQIEEEEAAEEVRGFVREDVISEEEEANTA